MTEFKFLNGGDTVIKLNGEVLGGVKKAVCRKNNTINKITEFLNETPVASFAESSYVVELEINLADVQFFDDKNTFDNIEFLNRQKNIRYSDCCVEQIESIVNPEGNVDYRVKIRAERRSVGNNDSRKSYQACRGKYSEV